MAKKNTAREDLVFATRPIMLQIFFKDRTVNTRCKELIKLYKETDRIKETPLTVGEYADKFLNTKK